VTSRIKIIKSGKLVEVNWEGCYTTSRILEYSHNNLNWLFPILNTVSCKEDLTPAKIAVRLGAFSSISEAKKNGLPNTTPEESGFYDYYISVPFGYSKSRFMPKYKSSFTVYFENWNDMVIN
jgi:hypothetical protein